MERMIMKKMNGIRKDLRNMKLKKTGYNEYSKFYYYELSDILVPIIEECEKQMLYPHITYPEGRGELTITDMETWEELKWEVPHGTAKLTACHDIQNVGAVLTYQRRYLYITAFEILEPDSLDSTSGKPEKKEYAKKDTKKSADVIPGTPIDDESDLPWKPEPITPNQLGFLEKVIEQNKYTNDEVVEILKGLGYDGLVLKELPKKNFNAILAKFKGE